MNVRTFVFVKVIVERERKCLICISCTGISVKIKVELRASVRSERVKRLPPIASSDTQTSCTVLDDCTVIGIISMEEIVVSMKRHSEQIILPNVLKVLDRCNQYGRASLQWLKHFNTI